MFSFFSDAKTLVMCDHKTRLLQTQKSFSADVPVNIIKFFCTALMFPYSVTKQLMDVTTVLTARAFMGTQVHASLNRNIQLQLCVAFK